ncbi:MAG TPA: hypothetical protein VNU66_03815 [Mycobacteriales bacterium]|nr:hypothetical protein [Mycobacteriales bacterium]
MSLTVAARLGLLGASALVLATALTGTALSGQSRLHGVQEAEHALVELQGRLNHLDTRSAELKATAFRAAAGGYDPAQLATDLSDDTASLQEAYADAAALPAPGPVRDALTAAGPQLDAYTAGVAAAVDRLPPTRARARTSPRRCRSATAPWTTSSRRCTSRWPRRSRAPSPRRSPSRRRCAGCCSARWWWGCSSSACWPGACCGP